MNVNGKANFKNVTAHSMIINNVDFNEEVDFEEGEVNGMTMEGVNFKYNDKKVSFREAKMRKANLTGLNKDIQYIPGKHPKKFDFTSADLTLADLSNSEFYDEAIFKKAILVGANLRKAKLAKADFTEANLKFAKLQGADLTEADFTKANLRYTNVKGADLRRAKFRGADIRGMKGLEDTELSGADFTGAKCWPAQYLMLKSKGVKNSCSIEERCRYLGSPTLIQTKTPPLSNCSDKDENGRDKAYCYAVVRCLGKDIPATSFRAFCTAKAGKCPDPELCAEEDMPKKYKVFIAAEHAREQADAPEDETNNTPTPSRATK